MQNGWALSGPPESRYLDGLPYLLALAPVSVRVAAPLAAMVRGAAFCKIMVDQLESYIAGSR